jgi:predicted amidohydrolase
MTQSRSLAVAQTCPAAGDVQANLDEHTRLAELAAKNGAAVVVFPELSLIGYEIEMADELAFSENDSRLSLLLDVAASHNLTLIVGASVRAESLLHIGAFILHSDRTTDLYTKHRLGAFPPSASRDSCNGSIPPAETTVFHPGDRNPLIRLGNHVAAVAVCADIGSPAHAQRAADCGADTYLASMFIIPSDFDCGAGRLSDYAARHHMVTCLANFGCPSGGLRSAGRSSIWSETGDLLVQLAVEGSGVAVVAETDSGRCTQSIILSNR